MAKRPSNPKPPAARQGPAVVDPAISAAGSGGPEAQAPAAAPQSPGPAASPPSGDQAAADASASGGAADQSAAASNDKPSRDDHQGGPAARPAAGALKASAAGFLGFDETLLGSDLVPEELELLGEMVPAGVIVQSAFAVSGLTAEAWNGLPQGVRDQVLGIAVRLHRQLAEGCAAMRALVEPVPEGFVEITARSRHGRPYRRGGQIWTAANQTLPVPAADEARVRSDPNLLVKAD